ncbi:MAG: hypothetical protein J6O71_02685 [Lachnospiraceae bacterium]|nr:hypothetical protein [Lachnospiraceae bacterium]
MEIIEISEENLESFGPLLGEDLTEDIKRIYYNGIGVADEDGKALGALVYELLNAESEEDTKARICRLKAADKEVLDALTAFYADSSTKENEVDKSFYELSEEDEAKTLNGIGFSMEKREGDALDVTLEELSRTSLGKQKILPEHVGNIEALSVLQFRDAVKQILFKGHRGLIEDIPYLPKSWFDSSVSSCVSSGGMVPGLFLIRRTPSGVLIPVLFFSYGPESKKDLLYMMRYSLQKALQIYPPETVVRIYRRTHSIRAITDNIIPNQKGKEIFWGERDEH